MTCQDMLAPAEKFQQASKILENILKAFIFEKVPQ